MSKIVIVLGDSGSGKTASLRNLPEGSAVIMSATGKELSFVNTNKLQLGKVGYKEVKGEQAAVLDAIQSIKSPVVVLDDANYLMTFENMSRSSEIGYSKFTDMAIHFYEIFDAISKKPGEQIFYIMAHSDTNEGTGRREMKTVGKMLSEKIVLEGLTNIVIESAYDELDGYTFNMQRTDSKSAAKAPMGMFEVSKTQNDLYEVDKVIRKFYGFAPISVSTPKAAK